MYKARLFSDFEFQFDELMNGIGVSLQDREFSEISNIVSELNEESLKVVEFSREGEKGKKAFKDVSLYRVDLFPTLIGGDYRYSAEIHLIGTEI